MSSRLETSCLKAAISQLNVGMAELAQSHRCLALAVLAIMRGNENDAIKQIEELGKRLSSAEAYVTRSGQLLRDLDNADI